MTVKSELQVCCNSKSAAGLVDIVEQIQEKANKSLRV